MAHDTHAQGSASLLDRESGGLRSLWLWVALLVGLAAAFVADGAVTAAVRPLHDSALADFTKQTVRWVGRGDFQAGALLLMVIVGAIASRRVRLAGSWGLLAFAVSGAAASLVKVIVHRPRPWVTEAAPEMWVGYLRAHDFQSFPSGESTASFAIAVAVSGWFPRLRIPLVAAAVAVAAARVLVGSHFPSDAWAGAILGIAVGKWVTALSRRQERRGPAAKA